MERLLEILSNMHPDVDFEKQDNLVRGGILDSFDIVTLVTEITEEFEVTIRAKDLVPENFDSAKTIYALIQKLEEEE
ncbi:MAG: phosphopantetheine-binding protein [Lachnospiraceae bacterium]|nr:phosphopantetheine-binding protein [Lachnospiraceae bacterium]